MSLETIETLIVTIVGVVVGSLITLFVSYKVDTYRDKKRDEKRLKSVAKTVASEIHAHKEFLLSVINGQETLKDKEVKLTDKQWEQNQKDIWELDPSTGVLFRRYYDRLGKIKTKQFTHDSNFEVEFKPLLKLADECLEKANFPLQRAVSKADLLRTVVKESPSKEVAESNKQQ